MDEINRERIVRERDIARKVLIEQTREEVIKVINNMGYAEAFNPKKPERQLFFVLRHQ